MAYLHKVIYTSAGSTDLTITMPYLLPEHIFVLRAAAGQVVGEETYLLQTNPTDWDFLDANTVRLVDPILAGETLVILRQTKLDYRMVNYSNGANLGEEDLNIVTKQLLYLIQEISEARLDGYGLTGGTIGGGGDGVLTPDEIDAIIDELLNRQLFLDLITLIPLLDINAELIIGNALKNHRDWLADGNFAYKLDAAGTLIQTLETQRLSSEEAFAQYQITVAARFDNNEASIQSTATAVSNAESAIATLQTEVTSLVPYDELEGLIVLSSYVNGVKTAADGNTAEISGIESYLVGIGDFLNPAPGSLGASMSILTTTVDGHAGRIDGVETDVTGHTADIADNAALISTGITWRQAMGSYFSAPDNGASLAAAIESSWQTYADSESTTAIRMDTLEANTAPMFFRALPPDPGDVEFANSGWAISGFPEGTMWYKVEAGNRTTPYMFSLLTADGAIALSKGYWIPASDYALENAMGVLIEETKEGVLSPGGSYASLKTTLQSAFGTSIGSVEQIIKTYLYPPDPFELRPTGLFYNSWNVRMNMSVGGNDPVMAGFGLGMQVDPNNPNEQIVSDFVVMADYFAVVAPPTVGTVLEGSINSSTILVPFIIDTATGQVVINGDLFVRGSLRAYEGGMYELNLGRLEVGQMDANVELVAPTGMRMGMYSSTNNWWTSNTASPFVGGSNPQKFLTWAGSGTMNAANAIFYVDTDGNAFFGGEVQADNINGDLSTADTVTVSRTTLSANSTVNPVWITYGTGNNPVFTNSGRPRSPMAMVNVNMFGSNQNEGRARMEMRYETSPSVWSSWTTVADSPIAIPTGTVLTLMGGLGFAVNYKVEMRVGILQQNGFSPQSNGYKGMFLFIS